MAKNQEIKATQVFIGVAAAGVPPGQGRDPGPHAGLAGGRMRRVQSQGAVHALFMLPKTHPPFMQPCNRHWAYFSDLIQGQTSFSLTCTHPGRMVIIKKNH